MSINLSIDPRKYEPLVTTDIKKSNLPGVVVEVDNEQAENMGAFNETALTRDDAWEANIDLEGDFLK